jgi:hypothetical protein
VINEAAAVCDRDKLASYLVPSLLEVETDASEVFKL